MCDDDVRDTIIDVLDDIHEKRLQELRFVLHEMLLTTVDAMGHEANMITDLLVRDTKHGLINDATSICYTIKEHSRTRDTVMDVTGVCIQHLKWPDMPYPSYLLRVVWMTKAMTRNQELLYKWCRAAHLFGSVWFDPQKQKLHAGPPGLWTAARLGAYESLSLIREFDTLNPHLLSATFM